MAQTGPHYARGRLPIQYSFHLPSFRDNASVITAGGDSMDKLLYHNLVEMIPLVESFMQDQQATKSFPRHASLVYTPTPSRESWPSKKGVDPSNKGKSGRGQPVSSRRAELRESALWDNTENILHDDYIYADDIPLVPYPSNQRAHRTTVPNADAIQLRRQIQHLEQKLSEKECQLHAVEKNAQQIHLQLNTTIEWLHSQIRHKDHSIQNIQDQLFERQLEVVSLQSLVKKSEVNVQASTMKAASLEEELDGLRSQVGTLLCFVQSHISGFVEEAENKTPPPDEESLEFEETVVEEPTSSSTTVASQSDEILANEVGGEGEQYIEEIRQKYLAALIDARENPSDEMLTLVADLRMQLHALVTCPTITSHMTKD